MSYEASSAILLAPSTVSEYVGSGLMHNGVSQGYVENLGKTIRRTRILLMVSEHIGRSSIHAVFQGTVENLCKTLRCTLILTSFSGCCCSHNSRKFWEDALVTRSRSAVSEDVSRSPMDDRVSQGNCRKSTQDASLFINPVNGL